VKFRVLSSLRLRSVNGFNDSIIQLFNSSTSGDRGLLTVDLSTISQFNSSTVQQFNSSTKTGDRRPLTVDISTISTLTRGIFKLFQLLHCILKINVFSLRFKIIEKL